MAFFDNIGRKTDTSYSGSRTGALSSTHSLPANTGASQGIAFTKGQVFKGEVIDLRGQDVKLMLPDSRILSAKLSNAMLLSIGQKAAFQVSDANSSNVLLKLVNQNTGSAMEIVMNKALSEAGLPKSERNLQAVSALLDQQLSINKDSIHKLLQNASTYKNASMETLAIMHKYNIPMNEVNTTQFEAYRNYEHRIINQTESIISSLSEFMSEDSSIFTELNNTIIDILANSDKSTQTPAPANQAGIAGQATTTATSDIPDSYTSVNMPEVSPAQSGTPEITSPHVSATNISDTQFISAVASSEPSSSQVQTATTPDEVPASTNMTAPEKQSPDKLPTLADTFKNVAKALEQGTITHRELLENDDYKELIKTALSNNFTLNPEELNEENGINKYYSRLEENLEKLNKVLEKMPEEHEVATQLKNNISNLKDNVQFMNTLNNIFAYVQLPLKLSNQNTHGELYVYTKKEKLRQNQDNISVLLHLDMAHLGPCDIYLNLTGTSITSKFYLEDTASIELIEQNISELTETLNKKGYSLSHEVLEREQRSHKIEDFISEDVQASQGTKRFTFDVRA